MLLNGVCERWSLGLDSGLVHSDSDRNEWPKPSHLLPAYLQWPDMLNVSVRTKRSITRQGIEVAEMF